jgi:hypothetical protein
MNTNDPDNTFPDARWGSADKPLPDWRDDPASDPGEDDDEDAGTPDALLAMLGYTPEEYEALIASFDKLD